MIYVLYVLGYLFCGLTTLYVVMRIGKNKLGILSKTRKIEESEIKECFREEGPIPWLIILGWPLSLLIVPGGLFISLCKKISPYTLFALQDKVYLSSYKLYLIISETIENKMLKLKRRMSNVQANNNRDTVQPSVSSKVW